jgi:hypothetical protein
MLAYQPGINWTHYLDYDQDNDTITINRSYSLHNARHKHPPIVGLPNFRINEDESYRRRDDWNTRLAISVTLSHRLGHVVTLPLSTGPISVYDIPQ